MIAWITRADLVWMVGLTAAIEVVTCLLRFVFKLRATRDTRRLAGLTFGVRIHHGYVGLGLLLLSPLLPLQGGLHGWVFCIGGALLLSDLVHHFVVLWITQGSPEFDLTYPEAGPPADGGDPTS